MSYLFLATDHKYQEWLQFSVATYRISQTLIETFTHDAIYKMDLRLIGWGGMDWIDLAQDRDQCRAIVNTVINLRVP
jgi:hypothetical protein